MDSGNKTFKKEMIFVMMLLHFSLFCLVNLLCFVFFVAVVPYFHQASFIRRETRQQAPINSCNS